MVSKCLEDLQGLKYAHSYFNTEVSESFRSLDYASASYRGLTKKFAENFWGFQWFRDGETG